MPIDIWFFAKIFSLFAILTYVVFASVVVRQVYLMTTTLKVGFETPIRILAWVNLATAILTFLFALLIL